MEAMRVKKITVFSEDDGSEGIAYMMLCKACGDYHFTIMFLEGNYDRMCVRCDKCHAMYRMHPLRENPFEAILGPSNP